MNTDTMGVHGNYYLKRAIVTLVGLGENIPEDAVCPYLGDAGGKQLIGANKYALHFAKSEISLVGAFRSITLSDKDGFPTANALHRNAIGDRDELNFNANGSLDLYFQSASPVKIGDIYLYEIEFDADRELCGRGSTAGSASRPLDLAWPIRL